MYTLPSGKTYIGKTDNETRRKTQHQRLARAGSAFPFHAAIRKYELTNFRYEVIVRNIPDFMVNAFEKYWINYHKSYIHGYNCTLGGEGVSGRTLSVDARTRISNARKGNKDWQGRNHTPESIKKISESHLGGKNPGAQAVINLTTGKIFASGAEAAKSLGLCTKAVNKAIRKNTKSGGYVWTKYLTTKEIT